MRRIGDGTLALNKLSLSPSIIAVTGVSLERLEGATAADTLPVSVGRLKAAAAATMHVTLGM